MVVDMPEEEWVGWFLGNWPHIMYHTRESVAVSPYRGPPRSILGFIDGTIAPVTSEEPVFFKMGTVHGDEQFFVRGVRYPLLCRPGWSATFGEEYTFLSQFEISPDKGGRYRMNDGTNIDVFYSYLRLKACATD